MSCCFDTYHFVGTPTFFWNHIVDFHIMGVNISRKAFPSQFSLLFSDHFVTPVSDNMLFLN